MLSLSLIIIWALSRRECTYVCIRLTSTRMAHYDNIIQEGKRYQVRINEDIVYLYVNSKKVKTVIARIYEAKFFRVSFIVD